MEIFVWLVIFIAGMGVGAWIGVAAARGKIEDANRRWRVATSVIQEIESGVNVRTALSAIERSSSKRDKPHPIIDLIHRLIDEFGPYVSSTSNASTNTADQERQRQLRKMWSHDRRKLEIERAKNGLPQFDDLKGMWSDDQTAVMKAHIKHGTAR